MNNKTLYKRLDEICAREHIVNKLSGNKYRTFVEPMEVSEVDVIHRIGEHLTRMVSSMLVYPNIGTVHD